MTMNRDDFTKRTKEILAKRVGYLCSNPMCRRLTTGPHSDPEKSVSIGTAAHVTAASKGGPRYNPNLSTIQRKSVSNGIWCCQTCGRFVDADDSKHTVETLLGWKADAESEADLSNSGLHIGKRFLSNLELLRLFHRSLESLRTFSNPNTWIARRLDTQILDLAKNGTNFLVAGSGSGKSVACSKWLSDHLKNHLSALVITHEIAAVSTSIEQAVRSAFSEMGQEISIDAAERLLYSAENPIRLVVEDINRAINPQAIIEKILRWNSEGNETWSLLCPVWPENLSLLEKDVKSRIENFLLLGERFSSEEGSAALCLKAQLAQKDLTTVEAEDISSLLNHDPLLIALYDFKDNPVPSQVIGSFISETLLRLQLSSSDALKFFLPQSLDKLAESMLMNSRLEISVDDVSNWFKSELNTLNAISKIAEDGQLLNLVFSGNRSKILFRHDRVRDWLLTKAILRMLQKEILPDALLGDPYFAEVFGMALCEPEATQDFAELLFKRNPLALFYALRIFRKSTTEVHFKICFLISQWITECAQIQSNRHARWAALSILADTDSSYILEIAPMLDTESYAGMLALLRNGNILGGLNLCQALEPAVTAPWRDRIISHAIQLYYDKFSEELKQHLQDSNLDSRKLIACLRFAGYLKNPELAPVIERFWAKDEKRIEHLQDYLWALSQCCGEHAERYLAPVCNEWGMLSDERNSTGSTARADVLHDCFSNAFAKEVPVNALSYFFTRAQQEDLDWYITNMLHAIDHPTVMEFLVNQFAKWVKEKRHMSAIFLRDRWKLALNGKRIMSAECRRFLKETWQGNQNKPEIRKQAFRLWAGQIDVRELPVLQSTFDRALADSVLSHRLILGDNTAIPSLIRKMKLKSWWAQYCWYVTSPQLTTELDKLLDKRAQGLKEDWHSVQDIDCFISSAMKHMPISEAETLLIKHWRHLRFCYRYLEAALFLATPKLIEQAKRVLTEDPDLIPLFQKVDFHSRHLYNGRKYPRSEEQIKALEPFYPFLDANEIADFGDECNEQGWLSTREKYLDQWLAKIEPTLGRRKCTNQLEASFFENLNKYDHRVEFWILDLYKAGIAWNQLKSKLAVWHQEKQSIHSLTLLANAIIHSGNRNDLQLLKAYETTPHIEATNIIEDTRFAVMRKSLV